jgi:hypothetical protein
MHRGALGPPVEGVMTTTNTTSASHARGAWPRGPSLLAFLSAGLIFIAGRLLDDVMQTAGLVVAVVAAVAGALWRVQSAGQGSGRAALVGRAVAAHAALGFAAVLWLALHLTLVPTGDAENVVTSLGVLLAVGGAAVAVALELLLAQTRATGIVDAPRVERATRTAVSLVSGLAAIVALVYGLQKDDARLELANAAPTSPSGATLAVVDTAACGASAEKPELFLFFEKGSTAYGEIADYFAGLQARGAIVQLLDQALDPALSKALKVTKNGVIAMRCGEKTDTWILGADRDEAQRKVKKLDAEIRTKLGKLVKDPQTVYFTVGHGERSLEGDGATKGRAQAKSLKKLLDGQNVTSKKLGIADGLTDQVPDDAALVVVLGPERPFLPEEAASLQAYVERGGALALFLDPPRPGAMLDEGDVDVVVSLQPVLRALGVATPAGEVMNDKEYVKQSGTAADHVFVFSTSFGTHKAVKTLNGARGKAALLFLSARSLTKIEAAASPKVSFIARSRPATFLDDNGNRRHDDPAEKRDIVDFAAAIEKKLDGDREARVLVVGDSDVVADTLLQNEANAVFAYEALLWLLRDDVSTADGASVVDDAPIRHTRDEDTLWFYGTTLLGPGAVILVGIIVTRLRRRRRRPAPTSSTAGGAP